MEMMMIVLIVSLSLFYLGWNFKKSMQMKAVSSKKCSGNCGSCSCGK